MNTVDTDPFEPEPVPDGQSVEKASGENPSVEDARMQRDSLLLSAVLRENDEPTTTTVRVRNLSAGGLMAEHESHYPRGTPIEIELRGLGKVRGKIAWSTDGRIGIAFDSPIDPMAARKPVGRSSTPVWPPR